MISQKINLDVRTMLEKMFEIIKQRFPDSLIAWDYLMEFLILDYRPLCFIGLNDSIEWLFNDSKLIDELMDVYDSVLLKSDYHDHLGEMYFDKFMSQQKQVLPLMLDAKDEVDKTISKTDEYRTVLDPAVGTGRRMMAANKVVPDAILFGVDKDLRLIRIALTNCAIHDIHTFLLHADFNKHSTDIETKDGEYNWQYANKWNSCMNKLKEIDKEEINRE